MTPQLRSLFAATSVVANLLVSATILLSVAWLVKFANVDAFEKFESPNSGAVFFY